MNVLHSLRHRFSSSGYLSCRRSAKRFQPQLEPLETRSLLSVTVHFSGSQMVVDGDDSGNWIRVDEVGSGEFAMQRISYHLAGIWVDVGEYRGFDSMLINSGAGSDIVDIDAPSCSRKTRSRSTALTARTLWTCIPSPMVRR